MNSKRLALGFLLGSAWLGLIDPHGLAAQLVPLGPEIDLRAAPFPKVPFVAAQPDGSYVVAWDEGADSHGQVFYRYVAAGGAPEDLWPFQIESPDESYPRVNAVVASRRGFDILWQEPTYGTPAAFYRQHLNLRGERAGAPIQLGGSGTDWVWHVRGNGFMAGWTLPARHAIAARRLDPSGQRAGKELRLNSRPVDDPEPVVLGLAAGGFLAVWHGVAPGPAARLVLRARRFSPKGKPLGPDFDVNSSPLGAAGLFDPAIQVAAAPGGGFAVAWRQPGQTEDTIHLRLFDAAGRALGPQLPAVRSEHRDDYESVPQSLAFDKAGNLLLLWVQWLADIDLRLQLFDPHGAPLGSPVSVWSEASDIYDVPWGGRATWTGSSWLVAWVASGAPSYDFNTIFVRRFATRR